MIVIICLIGLAVLAGLYAAPGRSPTAASSAVARSPDPGPLAVSSRGCLPGITDLRSGRSTLRIRNTGNSPEEVQILDDTHTYDYADLELVAPGTTRELIVVLPPGRFGASCEADDGTIGYSDPFQVTGPAVGGVHRWIPATLTDLGNAVTNYRTSVTAGLKQLASDTDALQAATDGQDRAMIKKRWLTAYLDYEQLGGVYDTFGDYADKINGLPSGLPRGVQDPAFTGFHKIEYLLWHNGSDDQIRAATRLLDRDVHGLVKAFPHQETAPNDVPLRTHEILENTMQLTLTGQDDLGSHSGLATTAANIDGTRMTLKALTPLLQQNDPALLASAEHSLDQLDAVVTSLHRRGGYPALRALSRTQQERLDGTLSGTLESLDPIPTELEVLLTQDNS
ncbi:iron transporter [Microlunatus endophyticus]|uniref:Iron transporter n=2 Tax=Microlunatus endophyticus TaxID=1716077 RepID=A0A917W233_9ACTN|nr:iron transporter [Microlunatus endophyticus]